MASAITTRSFASYLLTAVTAYASHKRFHLHNAHLASSVWQWQWQQADSGLQRKLSRLPCHLLLSSQTRLYMSYSCPYAQRAWITRNYKALQEKIKLVPIDMNDRPAWYKEVYPKNMIPSLEHNNTIIGESLDLIKYINSNFAGPKLTLDDSEKQRVAGELLAYSDIFNQAVRSTLISKGDVTAEAVAALDNIERSLSNFDDGPFFLGQFSLVDIAYVPFIDGFQILFAGIKKFDITEGRDNIRKFIEEMNKIDAYTQTKQDPSEVIALTKKKLGI